MNATNTQGMSNEALKALVAKMEAELAAAKEANAVAMRITIGPKGTVCVHGIGSKYGVALYQESWGKLAEFMPKVQEFIAANKGKLAVKGVEYVAPTPAAK